MSDMGRVIEIHVSNDEYVELTKKKSGQTWRQFIGLEARQVGRPRQEPLDDLYVPLQDRIDDHAKKISATDSLDDLYTPLGKRQKAMRDAERG